MSSITRDLNPRNRGKYPSWPVLFGTLLLSSAFLTGCASRGGRSDRAEDGKASWYGLEEQGGPTASGEGYNMNALTAAHPTLPLGSKVRVTNHNNNRTVVVRINDRFPRTKGRIIDLSRAAFASLAPLDQGVISVRIEVLSYGNPKTSQRRT